MFVDYLRHAYEYRQHHLRYERFVVNRSHPLICQDCGGSGGEVVPILDYGQGPWEACGWCEGTGYVTPYLRGMWLRCKREAITK